MISVVNKHSKSVAEAGSQSVFLVANDILLVILILEVNKVEDHVPSFHFSAKK